MPFPLPLAELRIIALLLALVSLCAPILAPSARAYDALFLFCLLGFFFTSLLSSTFILACFFAGAYVLIWTGNSIGDTFFCGSRCFAMSREVSIASGSSIGMVSKQQKAADTRAAQAAQQSGQLQAARSVKTARERVATVESESAKAMNNVLPGYYELRPTNMDNKEHMKPLVLLYDNTMTSFAKLSDADKTDNDKVLKSLSSGVTAESINERTTSYVASTNVNASMVCCGTCGKRRLPTIVHAAKRNRVARVDPSAIVYVDLDELAAKHPWVVLERGKCAACFEEHANATTAKAKAKLRPCSHPFVQCQTVVVAPFPPPPLTAEEVAHMADVKAKRVEAAPRPCAARACDSRGSEAGRFMAVPLALRPAFPVVQLPGTGAYWQSPWAVVEEGTAPVPFETPLLFTGSLLPCLDVELQGTALFAAVEPAYVRKAYTDSDGVFHADAVPMCYFCRARTGFVAPLMCFKRYPFGDPRRVTDVVAHGISLLPLSAVEKVVLCAGAALQLFAGHQAAAGQGRGAPHAGQLHWFSASVRWAHADAV